jgi:hypothetical protein
MKVGIAMHGLKLEDVVEPMIGENVLYHRAWKGGCIAIGLGKIAKRHPRCEALFYAEWEIRTYQSSWRIINNGEVIIAGNDDFHLIEDYMNNLDPVDWGKLTCASQLSRFDNRFCFDSGICLDMLGTVINSCAEVTDDEIDNAIEVFHPNEMVFLFDLKSGWKVKPCRRSIAQNPGYSELP